MGDETLQVDTCDLASCSRRFGEMLEMDGRHAQDCCIGRPFIFKKALIEIIDGYMCCSEESVGEADMRLNCVVLTPYAFQVCSTYFCCISQPRR